MGRLLDSIQEPADLRGLDYPALDRLAREVRQTIIDVITQRGGHLASNLGVVELTIALHRVFDSPRDKLVWDTTNQCYTHKLLTGRRDRFDSIRLERGLSGFGEPSESPHDVLCAGHAGTGVSTALGIALAEKLRGSDARTVAIVGDGALTAGLSFEALNNIAHLAPGNLVVVLNDNGMSISENIGFLTHWRQRITSHPEYQAMAARTRKLAQKVPRGELAYRLAKKPKDGVESVAMPTTLWREMGFEYMGPVDGHDIEQLERVLDQARGFTGKTPLVHVITHKGRGYAPAEQDPVKYHQPGSPLGAGSGAPTYSHVFAQTLIRLMRSDPTVTGITAAMMDGTGMVEAQRLFPDRIFDVGIAEQHAVTMAAGMARAGYRPFVSIYSTFLQRAFDRSSTTSASRPCRWCWWPTGPASSARTARRTTARSTSPISAACPTPSSARQRMRTSSSICSTPGTSTTAPSRSGSPGAAPSAFLWTPIFASFRWDRASCCGTDGTSPSWRLGKTVYPALEAAQSLADSGISCMVVNARFVKPLDRDLIVRSARATGRVLTVEENVLAGGFGSAVLEALSDAGLSDVQVARSGMPDAFVEQAAAEVQRANLGLDAAGIAARVRERFFPGTLAVETAQREAGAAAPA